MKILEIKRHLNKPDESYLCDLLNRGRQFVVLRYVSKEPGRVGDTVFDPGSITYAYYRRGGGYVLWRMFGPDHKLRGHLFHICRDLKVDKERVEYLDLLLDIWIDPDGRPTILDREEVEACTAQGVLNEQDLAWITQQEREIIDKWPHLISHFDRLEK